MAEKWQIDPHRNWVVVDENHADVAEFYDDERGRLIASAPELLERVRELERTFRHIHQGPDRLCKKCRLDLTDEVHERA